MPAVNPPAMLTFHRFMRLDELMLTSRALVNNAGREFIEQTFCQDSWTKNRYDITGLFLVACRQQDKKAMVFTQPRDNELPSLQPLLLKSIHLKAKVIGTYL